MPRRNRKVKKTIAVLDCETGPFEYDNFPIPFIWGLYAPGCGYKISGTIEEILDFLENKKWIVYAHNGGKFDFHFFLDAIPSKSELMIIDGRLVKFKIGECEFRDSISIIPVPLSAYKKDDFDYNKNRPENREKHMPEIIQYLKNDLKFTYELVYNFVATYGNKITIAQAAISQLKLLEDIEIPSSGKGFYDIMHPWYFGGRVEVFKPGIIRGPIQAIDLNSAYAYAMTQEHTCSIGSGTTIITEDDPEIIATNFYNVDCISRGAFPIREDKTDRLIFPRDIISREYFVTGYELIKAMELDLIFDVKHNYNVQFKETRNYTKYVEHFYGMKNEAEKNSPDYIFAKCLLVAAYGKFGANPDTYITTTVIKGEYAQAAREAGYKFGGDFGTRGAERVLVTTPIDDDKKHYYNVATAASITGFVRAMMMEALTQVNEPLYCDTDSIFFKGASELEIDDETLGAWGDDGLYDVGAICGKKMYSLIGAEGEKKASKGSKLTSEDIFDVANGKTVRKNQDAPVYSLTRAPYFTHKTIRMIGGQVFTEEDNTLPELVGVKLLELKKEVEKTGQNKRY